MDDIVYHAPPEPLTKIQQNHGDQFREIFDTLSTHLTSVLVSIMCVSVLEFEALIPRELWPHSITFVGNQQSHS